MEQELIDPMERAVRYLIPIPQTYYWDACQEEADYKDIPKSIKLWHNSIAGCVKVGSAIQTNIGLPLAQRLGLLDSRFQGTIDQLTPEELQESKRTVEQRRQEDESSRVV